MFFRFTFTFLIYIFSFIFFIQTSFGYVSSVILNSPPNLGQTLNTSIFFTFSAESMEYKENTTELSVNNESTKTHYLFIGNKTDDFPNITIILVNVSAENGILNISINGELAKSIQIPSTSITLTITDKNLLANQLNNFSYSTNTSGFVNITLVNVTYTLVSPFNCTLFVDGIPKVNKSVVSNQEITVSTDLEDGDHSWYVTCIDGETQKNSSTRKIGVGSNVSRCAIFLDENASYYLTQSVSGSSPCFRFLKKNSSLNCMYNTISGSGDSSSKGILLNKNFSKVYNCKISNWGKCIYIEYSYYVEVKNISCSSLRNGLYLYRASNSTLYNITATYITATSTPGGDSGILLYQFSCYNKIRLVNISGFDENIRVCLHGDENYFQDIYTAYGRRGIRIDGEKNYFENVNAEKNTEAGVLIDSSHNELRNVNVRENRKYGILVMSTGFPPVIKEIKLENVRASFNGIEGIRIGKGAVAPSYSVTISPVYLENITTYSNGHSGIFFSSSFNVTLKNAYLEENRLCMGIGTDCGFSPLVNLTAINLTCKHSFPLILVEDVYFSNSKVTMIRKPNITYRGTKAIFNFTLTYPNGTPCKNLTVNSINVLPEEEFSYSINKNLLEVNFSKRRNGYYLIIVNETDDKNNTVIWYLPEWNLTNFQYYFRSHDPWWWPVSERSNVGSFDFVKPVSDETISHGSRIQFSFDKMPFLPFYSGFIVKKISSMVYYKVSGSPGFGIEENVSYDDLVDKCISTQTSSNYISRKLEFSDLYIPIISPKDFYFITLKLVGNSPSIFTNATNLSTANVSVIAPSPLFIKNATKNVWILSESYQANPFNLKIYVEGIGTQNITISLPTNKSHEVKYDGIKCENSSACNSTQINTTLLLSLKLGSLHEIEISQIVNPPYFQKISIVPNSTVYSPNISIATNATVCDIDRDLKEVRIEVLGKNNTMENISQINENCTLFSMNLTGLPAGNITLKYYAIDETSSENETERKVEIRKENSSVSINITTCTETFVNKNATSYEESSIRINSCVDVPSWQVNSSLFKLYLNSHEKGNLTGNCIYYEFCPEVGEYQINSTFLGNQNYSSSFLLLWIKIISKPSETKPSSTGGGDTSTTLLLEEENKTEEMAIRNLPENRSIEKPKPIEKLKEEIEKIFGKVDKLNVQENKSVVDFENENPELEKKINSSFPNLTQIRVNASLMIARVWRGNVSFYLTKIEKTTRYPGIVEVFLIPNSSLVTFFKGNFTLLAEDPIYKIVTENGKYGYYVKGKTPINRTGTFIFPEKEEIPKTKYKGLELFFVSIGLAALVVMLFLSKRAKRKLLTSNFLFYLCP